MIIDAGIAVDWIVDTRFSKPAQAIARGKKLIAPDLLLAETANALWKHARSGALDHQRLRIALDHLPRAFAELSPTGPLLELAAEIALSHDQPISDCLYLALAAQRSEPLATADKRMAALAQKLSIEIELIEPAL